VLVAATAGQGEVPSNLKVQSDSQTVSTVSTVSKFSTVSTNQYSQYSQYSQGKLGCGRDALPRLLNRGASFANPAPLVFLR